MDELLPSWIVVDFTMPMFFTHHSVDFEIVGGDAGNFVPAGSFTLENSVVVVRVTSTLIALYVPAWTVIDSSATARPCSAVMIVRGPMSETELSDDSISTVCELFQVDPALTFGGMNVPLDATMVVLNFASCTSDMEPLAQSSSVLEVTPPAISVRIATLLPDVLTTFVV